MVDAHVHIDEYGSDLQEALKQIRNMSIRTLAVSMDIPSFRKSQRIAESEPLILPSFGIHPWKAPEYIDRLEELEEPLQNAPAIGEIGLDRRFVEEEEQYPAQETLFQYLLDAADHTGRLINLHTSGAESLILDALQKRNLPSIIVHWYAGPLNLVREYLELGAYFTIGVEVFRSDHIRSLASLLPADRILTETDNPGGWQWLYGETGYPELIEAVESEIAGIRGISREHVSETVASNFDEVLKAGGIQI